MKKKKQKLFVVAHQASIALGKTRYALILWVQVSQIQDTPASLPESTQIKSYDRPWLDMRNMWLCSSDCCYVHT